ncbi:MAG: TIGR04348 family glycosyltransferase [Rhodocyclales bacterium]|nr:TIGR04348 family glycosyltransferase [Rhodocyclales bacterium]
MAEARSMPQLVIVTPALRDANNGNWQTARRWQHLLQDRYYVRLVKQWPTSLSCSDNAMIALHARRSAESVAAWARAYPDRGLAVVLTGTDLYRDIAVDESARRSLQLASELVVLQEAGPAALPQALQPTCRVIYQSTTARKTLTKASRLLRAVMVGHLREEKSPETLFAAARLLADQPHIRIDHIGEALDPALGAAAQATMAAAPNYRWLGGLAHEETRRRIQRAHLLVHCSRMEGGAHVIMEAVASGTPVLASKIDGNIGMLGADYDGYFPWGDATALAALLRDCHDSRRPQHGDGLLETLMRQCARRAPLFAPEAERAALRRLASDLLKGR